VNVFNDFKESISEKDIFEENEELDKISNSFINMCGESMLIWSRWFGNNYEIYYENLKKLGFYFVEKF
jgi:hypothetical protein